VTLRSSTPSRPHEAHKELDKVDRDDEESAVWAELDDRFGFDGLKRDTADDELDLSRLAVALALDDFAGKDDVFEIEDREVVIVKSGRRTTARLISRSRSPSSGLRTPGAPRSSG
jgi:hypothetical protein